MTSCLQISIEVPLREYLEKARHQVDEASIGSCLKKSWLLGRGRRRGWRGDAVQRVGRREAAAACLVPDGG